jgi:hypothetical protein
MILASLFSVSLMTVLTKTVIKGCFRVMSFNTIMGRQGRERKESLLLSLNQRIL